MLDSRSQSFTTEMLDLGGGQTRKLSLTEAELNETMSDVRTRAGRTRGGHAPSISNLDVLIAFAEQALSTC